ncbi:ATP-binding protein [Streptomyces sp. NPDC057838]|uniref:ATP-binding protein n=1 Tax=unclassified Streptomyces TaxID=2593676 RepID=UPI0036D0C957
MSSHHDCPRIPDRSGPLSALRHGLRGQLGDWGADAVSDDACLVLSELFANARRHGTPPVRVAVTLRTGGPGPPSMRLEVADRGPGFDADAVRARWRHPSYPLAERGRGLYLVDRVSVAWGDRRTSAGHTVWADLRV